MLLPFAFGTLVSATLLNGGYQCHQGTALLILILLLMSGCWFVILFSNKLIAQALFGFLLGGIVGLSWVSVKLSALNAWVLSPSQINQPMVVRGTVRGNIVQTDFGVRFDLILKQGARVRLFWAKPTLQLAQGDTITAEVKLKPAWNFANPGSFDIEKQFWIEGLRAQGTVLDLIAIAHHDEVSLMRTRLRLKEKMNALMHDLSFKGVIIATSLGFNDYVEKHQWQVFQATGITHAIAISGLHISILAMICSGWIIFCIRRIHVCTLWLPLPYWQKISAFIVGWAYAAISGFSIPTLRAFLMMLIAMMALLLQRPILSWHNLALAWLGVFAISPFATLQIGFWLSFGCVAALIYGEHVLVNKSFWFKYLWPQIIVFIALIPPLAYFFHQIPLLSILANSIVLPLMNLIVVPASLAGLMLTSWSEFLARGCFVIANTTLELVWWFLKFIVAFPWSTLSVSTDIYGLLVGLIGVIWLLIPYGIPGRHLGWFALIPLFYNPTTTLAPGQFRFVLFDVGQGLAAIIHTQHHHLLFDTGPQYSKESNAGDRIILPYLRTNHITHLDKIIISHADLDHRGGLPGLRNLNIGELITSFPIKTTLPNHLCEAGRRWHWDGVDFEFLNGPSTQYRDRNNASCVLRISNAYHQILLTGDIEEQAERLILQRYGQKLKSDILVVAHHGSKTSSSPAFITAVNPSYALYPVGWHNRYHFPNKLVMQRFENLRSKNLLTFQTGAILFDIPAHEELTPPIHWRDTVNHYWNTVRIQGEKGD